jgi:hypothetical protein
MLLMKSPIKNSDFPIIIDAVFGSWNRYGEYIGLIMSFTNAVTSAAVAIPIMNASATEIIFYSFMKSMNSFKNPMLLTLIKNWEVKY